MIVPILVLSASLTGTVGARALFKSDACLNCTATCSILAPTGSSFPCYQGSPTDANKCYSTDPLISPSSTWVCDTCSTQGFPVYLQNDPVYTNMELWGQSGLNGQPNKRGSDACLDCSETCSILPPSGSTFPCYQGAPDDANFCFNTDPLITSTSTYVCGTCAEQGYSTYLQNDPIYKNMQLWNKASSLKDNTIPGKVCSCSADLCSIVPPSGSSFPCYQGTIEDATFCYNTDPLLNPQSAWSCSSCADEGYPSYLQNDPLYKSMELWVSS